LVAWLKLAQAGGMQHLSVYSKFGYLHQSSQPGSHEPQSAFDM
jgi:hypothetical protein